VVGDDPTAAVVAPAADRESAVPRVVWYTIDELALISRLPPEQVRAVYVAKERLDGEVIA
jgi:hypothetical protein